jgi:putative SOS response-associated peptidase YedK
MCGRFTTSASKTKALYSTYEKQLAQSWTLLRDRYDVRPATDVVALRHTAESGLELANVKWGLLPHWSKEPKLVYSTINARAETVDSKPAYRTPFRKRRCLIPASGWYEWKEIERGRKEKWWMHPADGSAFSFAGLWDRWERDGHIIDSCTIIVGDANERLRSVHDRMPVIIQPKDYDTWLNPALQDAKHLKELLQPAPDSFAEAQLVRNDKYPRDDDASLIKSES